jgi:phospholipase D1/2
MRLLVLHRNVNLSCQQIAVWDVFLLDSDFKIERPKRYYRQGLNFLHHPDTIDKSNDKESRSVNGQEKSAHQDDNATVRESSIRSRLSKVFHFRVTSADAARDQSLSQSLHRTHTDSSGSSASSSSIPSRAPSPMLDPSTNLNPLSPREGDEEHAASDKEKKRKKKRPLDVSKHTFYIENSQMRLKLFARNEVRSRFVSW